MVVLVIDGVFVANIKPATAIHKVQRTMRMFMVYSHRQRAAFPRHWLHIYSTGG